MPNPSQSTTQAVVVSQTTIRPSQTLEQIALFTPAGSPITLPAAAQTGATVILTGFATGSAAPISATDTLNQALAKLQARIVALEEALPED